MQKELSLRVKEYHWSEQLRPIMRLPLLVQAYKIIEKQTPKDLA